MPGLVGDLGKGDSPLEELCALVEVRDAETDVVDADVVEAVARSIDAGITWGVLADVLRGNGDDREEQLRLQPTERPGVNPR
jgi:hypothetical protein